MRYCPLYFAHIGACGASLLAELIDAIALAIVRQVQLMAGFKGLATLCQVDRVQPKLSAAILVPQVAPNGPMIEAHLGKDTLGGRRQLLLGHTLLHRRNVCELEGMSGTRLLVLLLPEKVGEDVPGEPKLGQEVSATDAFFLLHHAVPRIGAIAIGVGVQAAITRLLVMLDLNLGIVTGTFEDAFDHALCQHLDQNRCGPQEKHRGPLLRISALCGYRCRVRCRRHVYLLWKCGMFGSILRPIR